MVDKRKIWLNKRRCISVFSKELIVKFSFFEVVIEIGTFTTEELALRFRDADLGSLLLFLFLFFLLLWVLLTMCVLRYDVVEIRGFGLTTSTLPGLFLALSFEVLSFVVILDLELHWIVLNLFLLSFLFFYHFSTNLLLNFFEFLFILELVSDTLDSFFKKVPGADFIFNSKIIFNCHWLDQSFGLFLIVQNIDFSSKERGEGFRTIEFHDKVLFEGV